MAPPEGEAAEGSEVGVVRPEGAGKDSRGREGTAEDAMADAEVLREEKEGVDLQEDGMRCFARGRCKGPQWQRILRRGAAT